MIEDFISSFLGGTATVVGKVVVGAERLFGDDPPKESPVDRTNIALFGPGRPQDRAAAPSTASGRPRRRSGGSIPVRAGCRTAQDKPASPTGTTSMRRR